MAQLSYLNCTPFQFGYAQRTSSRQSRCILEHIALLLDTEHFPNHFPIRAHPQFSFHILLGRVLKYIFQGGWYITMNINFSPFQYDQRRQLHLPDVWAAVFGEMIAIKFKISILESSFITVFLQKYL